MKRLENPIRRYAWGSLDAIPRLLGVSPDGEPQAELWLGAHERASSRVLAGDEWISLLDLVRRDPRAELGADWDAHARLPFLAKVIAVAAPLSLQVHPDTDSAARGFAAEEARGVDRDVLARSFPDAVAKEEMVWALSEFRAVCGFRPADEAVGWLEALDIAALKPTIEALRHQGRRCFPDEVVRLLRLPSPADVVAAVRSRAGVLATDPRWRESATVAAELAARHRDDGAVCVALLLRPVVLARGEAMFVAPGQPHSYLSGTAFEVQANSDNVLRAGLTGKQVDVEMLAQALDPDGDGVAAVSAQPDGDELVFSPDTPRFALSVVHDSRGTAPLPQIPGPQVFLCVDGEFVLDDGLVRATLTAGAAAYASAADGPVRVHGSGTLLRVTTGRATRRGGP